MSLVYYVLESLLFLALLLLHSAQDSLSQRDCVFNCGKLGELYPPFTNNTDSKCAKFFLSCNEDEPKVQFSEQGKRYHVDFINPSIRKFQIRDQELEGYLQSNQCGLLNNFTDQAYLLNNFTQQHYPFFSIKFKETHPFLKCKRGPPLDFVTQFRRYGRCADGYDLYYHNDETRHLPLPANLPNHCTVVSIPSADPYTKWSKDDLTSFWSATFNIEWKLLPDSDKFSTNGGLCSANATNGFECQTKKGPYNRRKILIVIALSVAGVGSTVVLLVLVCHISKKKTVTSISFDAFMKDQVSLGPKRYSFKEIRRMTKSFKNKLGQGGYGSVFQGTLSDGNFVAVKVLTTAKGNGEEFINEVASISRTSHVNIVSLLGYCFDGSKRALIYEYMPNGSLEKYIFNKESSGHFNLGWGTLYQIAVGIARGLEYLHRGCNTRILHFDIKPHNILLDQEFCPKISDFGLAKLCPREDSIISMLGARGTAGYIAPEVLCRNFGGVSHKSDVYSYGMMILEMVGGRKNIDVAVDHTSEIYFPHWIYKRIELDEQLGLHGIVSEEQRGQTRKMILVGLWCIQTNPADRPSISRVLEMLEGSVEVLEMPPKPYLSSPSRDFVS